MRAVMLLLPALARSRGLQFLHVVVFQRSAYRSHRNQPQPFPPQCFDRGVLVGFGEHGSHRVAGDVAFRSQGAQRCRHRRSLPHHFHLAMNAGGEIGHRAHSSQFALMDDGDAIAQGFRIRQNMSGEENRLAFVLQLRHEVANFTAAHGIQTGHRLVKENNFRIMQNGLCDSHALQHAFGKFSQLHSAYLGQADAVQDFIHFASTVCLGSMPESWP